jgi:hypothetical protein
VLGGAGHETEFGPFSAEFVVLDVDALVHGILVPTKNVPIKMRLFLEEAAGEKEIE